MLMLGCKGLKNFRRERKQTKESQQQNKICSVLLRKVMLGHLREQLSPSPSYPESQIHFLELSSVYRH